MAFKMKKFSGFGKGTGKQTPMNFNAGLRKASREGKLDNNPKFKAAVDNAPMKKAGVPNDKAPAKQAKKDPMPNAKPKDVGKETFIGPRNKIVGEGYHKEKKGKIKAVKSKVKKRPTTVGDVARGVKNTLKTAGRKIGKTKIRDVGIGVATGNLGGVIAKQLIKKEKDSPNKIVDKVKKRVKKVKKGVSNVLRKGDQLVAGIGNPQYRKMLKEKKKKAAEKKLKDVNEFN